MNESDLMTSLPPVLPPISRYHNSSSLNYSDTGACFMIQQAVSRTSTAHVPYAEGKVPKSVRVALTYEKYLFLLKSTAVDQVVACAPVTQRARVRSPVGTNFLGEVFSGFFLTCKTNVGKLQAAKVPEYHYHPYSFITGANDLRC